MEKTIETHLNNVYGFEGHARADPGATSLCLEKILCLMKATESGENLPRVSMVHYTTSRIKRKKRNIIFKNVKITKHHYDIAVPSFGKLGDGGDGNHRTFMYKIMQIPQPIKIIHEDDWTLTRIPEEIKTDFSDIKIASNYSLVEQRKEKYNIPEELKSATKFPTNAQIEIFFKKRIDKKITYQEIINNLYK